MLRLGRLPHDPARLALLPKHRFGAETPPDELRRSLDSFKPGLYSNDTLPDCTAVALANGARAVAYLNGFSLVVYNRYVPRFYSACIGNPADLADSSGANMLDVLEYQASHGYEIGPQTITGNYGTVDCTVRSDIAWAVARLGFCYMGVTLYEGDLDAFRNRRPWTVDYPTGAVAGGHAVPMWTYAGLGDHSLTQVGTWGAWQSATWEWVHARTEEAYGLVWRQLVPADGLYYDGVTPDGLVTELDAEAGGGPIGSTP